MKLKFTLAFIFFNFINLFLYGQNPTPKEVELDLQNRYKKLLSYRFGDSINFDSLEIENERFLTKFSNYISEYSFTLSYPFDSLKKENIDIVTSEDGLFRVYSWGTWLGGTMQDFRNIFQYKSNNKVFSHVQLDTSTFAEGEYIPFYSEIFTLKTENKKYYLGVNNGIYTSKDCSQAIKAFEINDNKLIDSLNLFKTSDGLQNDILINFDFFSVVDRPERPLKLIRYDSEKKLIYIPEISDKDQVLNKYSVYKFMGQYFERVGSKRRIKIKSI